MARHQAAYTKNRAPTRESILFFFRKIHNFLLQRLYLTWTWFDLTLQAIFKNTTEGYFLLVPPLLINNSKQLISESKKYHLQENPSHACSKIFTLHRTRDHISPGPGKIELS